MSRHRWSAAALVAVGAGLLTRTLLLLTIELGEISERMSLGYPLENAIPLEFPSHAGRGDVVDPLSSDTGSRTRSSLAFGSA